jgi:hypothetical protein
VSQNKQPNTKISLLGQKKEIITDYFYFKSCVLSIVEKAVNIKTIPPGQTTPGKLPFFRKRGKVVSEHTSLAQATLRRHLRFSRRRERLRSSSAF